MSREESTNNSIHTITECMKMKSDAGIDTGNDAELFTILSEIALSLAKIADNTEEIKKMSKTLEEINDSL